MNVIAVERAPARTPRHYAYLQMRTPDAWSSFALAFGFAMAGLVAETSGAKPAAVTYLALIGLVTLLFPHFTIKANVRNALLWLVPIWALLSTAWSLEPDQTFHASLLILVSMVAVCFIGAIPHRRAVNTGFFLTLFLFILYSVVHGQMWRIASDDMFTGAISRKNQFGHLAALETLLSLGMLSWRGTREGSLVLAAAATGFLCGLGALVASHATGSLISTGVSIICFVVVLTFRRMTLPFRITALAALAALVILYLSFGEALQEQVIAGVMQKFGKDSTLTGRTLLWDIADRMIAQHPYIGRGAAAFWSIKNPDAWLIWREMKVQPGTGFTFHNTFRDTLVDVGWIGLGLYILAVGWRFALTWFVALRSAEVTDASRAAILTYFLIRTPVETIGYGGLTMDIFLLIGFLCIPATVATQSRAQSPEEQEQPPRRATAPIERLSAPARERRQVRSASPASGFRTG